MYGVLIAASATIVLGMVASSSNNWIPFVLIFDALITVGLGVAIIVIAWKDPSRLMLGQVTASEYATIRRLHLGDDKTGERRTEVVGAGLKETAVQEDESPPPQAESFGRPGLTMGEEVNDDDV